MVGPSVDDPVSSTSWSMNSGHRSDEGRGATGLLDAADQGSSKTQDGLDRCAAGSRRGADLPVYKRNRVSAPMVSCNDGLHFYALVLMPPASRLKGSLADHFGSNLDLYARPGTLVERVDVRPVVDGHRRVVDYVFKTVMNGRLSYDDAVLVLPRVREELEVA
jgi:hypothetical protein